MEEQKKWFQHFHKPIGVNVWAPEWYTQSIRNFDARKIAEIVKKSGSTVGFTFQGFSQDHFGVSFFPTKLGHQHVNLMDGRDHIAEYQGALQEIDAKFFAYYCYQDRILWDKNPDWRIMREDGSSELDDNFGYLCPNSPYRDHVILRMSEIAENYAPDGWLLDMIQFSSGVPTCYCDYCKRAYRLSFGLDLPTGMPSASEEWLRFLQWRYDCIEGLFIDIIAGIRKFTPDTVITHNAFAFWGPDDWVLGQDYEAMFEHNDVVTNIVTWEFGTSNGVGRSPDLIWRTGYFTRMWRALSQKPVWMQMGRFLYQRDYTMIPERELELAVFSVITNGGCPFVIDNVYPDGNIDSIATESIAKVYKKIAEKEQYLEYDNETVHVGLLYSKKNHDLSSLANPGKGFYIDGFLGAYKILVESHIPFDVFSDRTLDAKKLSHYEVVILSEYALMTKETASLLSEYVQNGGKLICLGKTGMIDGEGNHLADTLLNDVLGISCRGPLNYNTSFAVPLDNEICSLVDKRLLIPMRECYPERFSVLAETQVVMYSEVPSTEIVPKHRVFTYGNDTSPGKRQEPLASVNNFGTGKAIYIGGNIARIYGIYGDPNLRKLFEGVVRWCGRSPIETNAPSCVEMTCYQKGTREVLHMINYAGSYLRSTLSVGGPALEDAIPIYNIEISLVASSKPKSVMLEDHTILPFHYNEGRILFTVPKLDTHLLVIIE